MAILSTEAEEYLTLIHKVEESLFGSAVESDAPLQQRVEFELLSKNYCLDKQEPGFNIGDVLEYSKL